MTIRRIASLLPGTSLEVAFIRFHTPANLAAPLTRSPFLREYTVTRVSALAVKVC